MLYPMMMIKGADGRIEKEQLLSMIWPFNHLISNFISKNNTQTAESQTEAEEFCKSKVTGYHHTTDAQQDHHRLPDYTHQGYDADDAML